MLTPVHIRYIINICSIVVVLYLISRRRIMFSEIIIVALFSTLLMAIYDRHKLPLEGFFSHYSSKNHGLPPGGLRSEVLPLASKKQSSLSLIDCKKISNYLMVNPVERINDKKLDKTFKYCQNMEKEMKRRVKFNDRVQTITTNGSIDSESIKSFC